MNFIDNYHRFLASLTSSKCQISSINFFSLISIWTVVVALAFPDTSCIHGNSSSLHFNGSIKIGMAAPFSGSLSSQMGDIIQRRVHGLEIYQRWVQNCLGGLLVGGQLLGVDLIFLDDKGERSRNINQTKQLIQDYQVDFLFPSLPHHTSAGIEYGEKDKVISMLDLGSPTVCDGKEYCFSVRTANSELMSSIINVLALHGARSVVYFSPENQPELREMCGGILSMVGEFAEMLDGFPFLYRNTTSSAFSDLVKEIKKIDNPIDIIIGCTDFCHTFINESKNLGLNANAMVFPNCINSNKMDLLGDDARYILGPANWDENMDYICEITEMSPSSFGDAYRALYETDPLDTGAAAFAGALALGQAAILADSLDPDALKLALSHLNIQTMFGRINFNEGNFNSQAVPFQQINENLRANIVTPKSIATGTLIYPMPSWLSRECIEAEGVNACVCQEEGCPQCVLSDYHFAITSCNQRSMVRYVQYMKDTNSSDCEGGVAPPDDFELECDYVPFESKEGSAIASISIFGAGISFIYFIWVLLNRKKRIVDYSQPTFCLLFSMFGCLFSLSTLLFLGPYTNQKCLLRVWAFHLSFTGMIGSLFVKVYRVWLLFVSKRKPAKRVKVPAKAMLMPLSAVIFIDVMILSLMTGLNPPRIFYWSYEIPNTVSIPWTAWTKSETFSTALFLYEITIVVIGCYFSFQTRAVGQHFSESKFIMFAIYSIMLVLGTSLLVSFQDIKNLQLSLLLQSVGVSFSTIMALTCVLLPKVILCHSDLSKSSLYKDESRRSTMSGDLPRFMSYQNRSSRSGMMMISSKSSFAGSKRLDSSMKLKKSHGGVTYVSPRTNAFAPPPLQQQKSSSLKRLIYCSPGRKVHSGQQCERKKEKHSFLELNEKTTTYKNLEKMTTKDSWNKGDYEKLIDSKCRRIFELEAELEQFRISAASS